MAIVSHQKTVAKHLETKNRRYILFVVAIVVFFNLPSLFLVFVRFGVSAGFSLGSLGSVIYFFLTAHSTQKALDSTHLRKSLLKGAYLRNIFLVLYSITLVWQLPISIIAFGCGLLSVQIAIFAYEIVIRFSKLSKTRFYEKKSS